MALSDFVEDGKLNDTINYNDYNRDLADATDDHVKNDSWRSNWKQPYFVTNTIERTLERVSDDPAKRHDEIPDIRLEVQKDLADKANVDLRTVQQHCHSSLFSDDEEAPTQRVWNGSRTMWVDLFDQLILELARKGVLDDQ